jgi:GNAT superfamily N-acetyltransferase
LKVEYTYEVDNRFPDFLIPVYFRCMEIFFEKATSADIPLIHSMAEKIWWAHYPSVITNDQIEYMLQMMYSEKAITLQMEQKQNYTLIYADGEAVGYYAVTEKSPHKFFLNKFYIDTIKHRIGIGAAAFDHIKSNDCKGFEEITLQVNRRNIKAVNFYFKHGFVIDYVDDFDIGNGYTMDDFFMKLKALKD